MAYTCNDCSYRGVSSGHAGQCPACGSFNLLVNSQDAGSQDKPAPKWQLPLVIALWTVLLLMLVWKLLN